jgi:hypothetical protein
MKYTCRFSVLLCLAVASVLALFLPPLAEAQCSMCRAALNGSGNSQFIRSFNLGVVVLLIPPVTIFCSIFIVLRRHKNGEE